MFSVPTNSVEHTALNTPSRKVPATPVMKGDPMSKRKRKCPNAPAWVYLDTDGGWLTTEGIAMEVNRAVQTIDRSMWRWHKHGHVETRSVSLAYSGGLNSRGSANRVMEARREWRTL